MSSTKTKKKPAPPPAVKERTASVPLAKIHPDPENQSRLVDAAFVSSVRHHGVIQPIIVVEHPDEPGEFMLVAGERRLTAAKTVGLESLSVIVREYNVEQRISAQAVENLKRSDLSPVQEARQIMRLSALGYTVARLAREVGHTKNWVSTRLKIIELPAAALTLLDQGTWTLEDAVAATELLDLADSDRLDELIGQGRGGNVAFQVRRILREHRFEVAAAAKIKSAADAGTVVIGTGDAHKTLDEIGISNDAHVGEPCHAMKLRRRQEDAELVAVCVDPKRHNKSGKSELKKPANRPGGLSEEERAKRVATREAAENRSDAMRLVVASKLSKARGHELIVWALLDQVSADHAKRACEVLGLEAPVQAHSNHKDHRRALREFIDKSDINRYRAGLVVAMVSHEASFRAGWPRLAATRWMTWMKEQGWTPTKWDRAHAKAQRRK